MRAIVMRDFGGPEVLRLEDVAPPAPRAGWVPVRLRAAALNWHDVLVRRGQYASPLPHTPGADGAGVREDTGQEVLVLPSLFWGDRPEAPAAGFEILGDRRAGTYAERVLVPEECLVPVTGALRSWTWAERAALPLVGVTTYRALFSRGRLRPGESVLVLGAGGGVATTATTLAAAVGAHVVVTSSSAEKIARAQELGAAAGVDYGSDEWPQRARELSVDGAGFDLVLDSVGSWAQSLAATRPGGRVVVLGASRGEQAQLAVRPFYFGQFDLLGTTMGSRADFDGLMHLLDGNAVPPPRIDSTFALAEAAAAHRRMEEGTAFGKIVLDMG